MATTLLTLSYHTGRCDAFTKLGLQELPELGSGERKMLEDADMPGDIRRTELDSYLQRALTAPISSEQDFMEQGKIRGTVGGGIGGAGLGGLTGYGLGRLSGHGGKGALIGALGAGTLGALLGRPLGAESGRREHTSQQDRQDQLGGIYTDPYQMQRELQRHLATGRKKKDEQSKDHELNLAEMNRPRTHNTKLNNVSVNNNDAYGYGH